VRDSQPQPSTAPGPAQPAADSSTARTPATGNQSGAGPSRAGSGGCFLGICDARSWPEGAVSTIVGNFLGGLISGMNSAAGSFFNNFNFLARTAGALVSAATGGQLLGRDAGRVLRPAGPW
jgi:hypothetical protein